MVDMIKATATVSCGNNMSGSQVHICSRPQHPWISGGVHCATGDPSELKIQEDSAPITIFLLFFMEVIQLLLAEAYKYYNQYLDTFDSDS
jgi:hypothetical protein